MNAVLAAQTENDPPAPSTSVTHYDAYLEPDPETKSIKGSVILTLDPQSAARETVTLDRGDLDVDSVECDGIPVPFELERQQLRISLHAASTRPTNVTVRYHGSPQSGLLFFPERRQMYTLFSTSQWMVALDAPNARASLRLRLVVPRGWTVVSNGREVARRNLSDKTELSEWRQDRAVPTYTFGFAAGQFTRVTQRDRRVTLQYVGNGFSKTELQGVFNESRRMLEFFNERSGVPYPGGLYSQVLVPRTVGQEMAGFSVVSEEYGRAILADPSAVSLLAHELAHQWWGNMVTCRDWTHFWLNEGFATFMAAAYREQRFGRKVYLEDVDGMRARYERVRDAGHDRSLVFPDWDKPTADDRTLVYQKGAYVLYLLRESIGDQMFWAGIRRYTTTNFGRSVTTEDFQRAMEQASGRDLHAFFSRWVYLSPVIANGALR